MNPGASRYLPSHASVYLSQDSRQLSIALTLTPTKDTMLAILNLLLQSLFHTVPDTVATLFGSLSSLSSLHQSLHLLPSAQPNSTPSIGSRQAFVMMMMPSPPTPISTKKPNAHAMLISSPPQNPNSKRPHPKPHHEKKNPPDRNPR